MPEGPDTRIRYKKFHPPLGERILNPLTTFDLPKNVSRYLEGIPKPRYFWSSPDCLP